MYSKIGTKIIKEIDELSNMFKYGLKSKETDTRAELRFTATLLKPKPRPLPPREPYMYIAMRGIIHLFESEANGRGACKWAPTPAQRFGRKRCAQP